MASVAKTPETPRRTETAPRTVRLGLAVALLMPAPQAWAQFDANCTQALRFATFAPCGAGGTIEITPASGKINTAGCVAVLGTPKRAICTAKSFATTGSIQAKVSAKTVSVTGPATMTVKDFHIGTAAGGPTKTYTSVSLTATPITFGVGGQIGVAMGQGVGNYSGQVIMTVIFTP